MKIKSPIVTLLVGVLIAALVVIVSVNAHTKPYHGAAMAAVAR